MQPVPQTLRPFVETLQVGDPIGHSNLTVVPLRTAKPGQLDYSLAAEAIKAGTLTVTEASEGGSVPELLAMNQAAEMILLLDGEELVGAKQNRILNTSVLLAGNSKTKIPVSCVEQGRWHHTSMQFSSGSYSPAKLRSLKSRDVSRNLASQGEARSDQGAVWDEVERNAASSGVNSPTRAMHDAFEQHATKLSGYVESLQYPQDACGVIMAIDGKFVAADIFDRPATLQRIWPRLMRGYAMDAMTLPPVEKAKDFTAKGASALLEHVGQVTCRPCPTVGVGEDWRFEADNILGQALVAHGQCPHLCIFPNDEHGDGRPGEPSILPPSSRRRRRGGGEIVH